MTLTRERPATELWPDGLSDDRPVLTIDMDGVFCSPFFGWNVGISSAFLDPDEAITRIASMTRTAWTRRRGSRVCRPAGSACRGTRCGSIPAARSRTPGRLLRDFAKYVGWWW